MVGFLPCLNEEMEGETCALNPRLEKCHWIEEEEEEKCEGGWQWQWQSTRLNSEDNPEEVEAWIQREFI